MENRYPWFRVAFLSAFLFIGFYLITFIVTATSYGLFFQEPADRSRGYSWIYYGIFFSVLPYLPMGALLYKFFRQWPLMLTLHAVGLCLLIEKGGFVYLGTLLGTGYPWYGRNFPRSGFGVLCEELPMYCGHYALNYVILGSAIALGAFYSGTLISKIIARS